MIILQMFGTK